MFKYLLVDEHWTHIGEFEAELPDWSVGKELATGGRSLAIVGIVPNPDPDGEFTATWQVEPA
jgi:hypothetical protein